MPTKVTQHFFSIALVFCAAFASAAPDEFATAVLGDDPILYYRMSELGNTTTNLGSLGSAFDGTINGAPLQGVPMSSGDAGMQFTGVDDFIESLAVAPPSLTGNPDFSAETLIRVPAGALAVGWPPFLHWGMPGTGNSVYFSLRQNNNNIVYAGFYNAGLMTSVPICFDTWLHVVWTRDSNGGTNDSETGTTLYINGNPVALIRDPVLNPGFDANLTITATTFTVNRATDFTRFSTIEMDEVALYDRVLDAAEVAEHWQAFAANAGDADGDGLNDTADNCVVVPNTSQRDSNADGFGNRCDADLDGSYIVNAIDLGIFKSVFFTADMDADFNGDGVVNAIDLGVMRLLFFGSPGPSGTQAQCGS